MKCATGIQVHISEFSFSKKIQFTGNLRCERQSKNRRWTMIELITLISTAPDFARRFVGQANAYA